MKTLTDRKIAEQEKVTYTTQKEAQTTRQQLEQATALADTQARVVDAERSVTIAEFGAKASVRNAEGQAGAKKVQAEADAMVITIVGMLKLARPGRLALPKQRSPRQRSRRWNLETSQPSRLPSHWQKTTSNLFPIFLSQEAGLMEGGRLSMSSLPI